MRSLRPTYHIESFAGLPVEEMAANGIKAIAFDLDQTVLPHHGEEIPDANIETFNRMAHCAIKPLILSNADKQHRVERTLSIRDQIQERSELERMIDIVASAAVGHRKGHRTMFEAASSVLCLPPAEIAMVDDQLWRGVGGANRAGFGATIKVDPIGECGNKLKDHPMRWLENACSLVVLPVYDLQPRTIGLGAGQAVLSPAEETV